eukprot:scaffold1402_cov109-Isochrysis_galbana.AAC.1
MRSGPDRSEARGAGLSCTHLLQKRASSHSECRAASWPSAGAQLADGHGRMSSRWAARPGAV